MQDFNGMINQVLLDEDCHASRTWSDSRAQYERLHSTLLSAKIALLEEVARRKEAEEKFEKLLNKLLLNEKI